MNIQPIGINQNHQQSFGVTLKTEEVIQAVVQRRL